MVTPNYKIILLIHHNCNFATIMTCKYWCFLMVWWESFNPQRGCNPQVENCHFSTKVPLPIKMLCGLFCKVSSHDLFWPLHSLLCFQRLQVALSEMTRLCLCVWDMRRWEGLPNWVWNLKQVVLRGASGDFSSLHFLFPHALTFLEAIVNRRQSTSQGT